MQPFDYRLAVQNPVQMALQGYMQGQQMVGQREEAAMNRELFDLKKQEFQMGQQKLAQEQAQARAMQTDLAGFAERLATNAATIDDVISLSAKYPEIGEQVQASWTMKSDADKEATKKELVRFGSALKFSPDVATRLISERVTALEENGAPEALAAAQSIKGYLDMDMPEAALASIVLQANNVMKPEEFEAFSSVIMPKTPEAVSATGKIIQDWESGLYEKLYGPEGAQEAALKDIRAAQEGRGQTINVGLPGMGGVDLGPTPPGTYTERDRVTGELRNVPIPGSPVEREVRSGTQAKSSLESTFETMFLGYKDLQTAGAIRDVEKGAGSNIAAYLQTSPLGREIGKATGAPAEATREAIEALQPSISQAIMAQPGMSAKGMDSERELAFFIKSITSPTTDVNTNFATLHALDMRFGSGQLLKKMLAEKVITQNEYNKITRSSRVSSVLTQLDDKVDELFTMEEAAKAAPKAPSRLQKYFGEE